MQKVLGVSCQEKTRCQVSGVRCQGNSKPITYNLKPSTWHPRASRAFTLIELLVVIAIIGILAAIILASLSSAKAKGNDAKRLSDIKQIQLALELYNDQNNGYPASSGGSVENVSALSTYLVSGGDISQIPTDPTSGNYYQYISTDGGGGSCSTGPCAGYVLQTDLQTNAATGVTSSPPIPSSGINCTPSGSNYYYCQTN